MIVEMKKLSLLVLDKQKKQALASLRSLGAVHVETSLGQGESRDAIKLQMSDVETALAVFEDIGSVGAEQKQADDGELLDISKKIKELLGKKSEAKARLNNFIREDERLKTWGEIDPAEIKELSDKGVRLSFYEMPIKEYQNLVSDMSAIVFTRQKKTIRFALVGETGKKQEALLTYALKLPELSTEEIRISIQAELDNIRAIENEIKSMAVHLEGFKRLYEKLSAKDEFEALVLGMTKEVISNNGDSELSVARLDGYIPTEDVPRLKALAAEKSWGLCLSEPGGDDNVPTKLKNNRFVSLIYPLTDFLGTVPGYFEYDISAWFLGFVLIFFGIIFGDGGYGLLICAVASALILKAKFSGKKTEPLYLLVGLLGLATLVWGVLTCSWFGIDAKEVPLILQRLSVPFISNVNAERIWHLPWTKGDVGLTTAQNLQIFCFALALVQLCTAHIKGMIKNRKSLKAIGDLGSALQLLGMFYVVLSLVVNSEVFPLGLYVAGVPVGTLAISTVLLGFCMSFIFANYDGSIKQSILESLKNIVSVLLGVVNVFSDIVSYIRLWAVAMAGAAISATVNELAGPFMGKLTLVAVAAIILVFGHGLNIILNILSVIVHGVRLNTLEFSSHLDMSWSGHKYEPFNEKPNYKI